MKRLVLVLTLVAAFAVDSAFGGQKEMLDLTREAIALPSNQIAKKIELYTQAIEEYPGFYLPWTNRAVGYLNYAQWDQAIADATEAISLAPENPHPWGVRGRAFAGQRKFEQAFEDLSRALELAETDEESRNLYNDRGNAYYSARRYEEAARDYEQAVEIDETFSKGYNNLGIVYRSLGDYDKAISYLNRALRWDSASARALVNRARVYMGRQDPVMAAQDFDKAIELDDRDASAYLHRGGYRYVQGDFQGARSDFSESLQLRESNPYAAIWRYLAQSALDLEEDATVKLEQYSEELGDREFWPRPVIDLYLGKATVEDVMSAAERTNDEVRKRERLAEANFYAAEYFRLKKDAEAEKEHLTKAIAQDTPRSQEFLLARIALEGWQTPQPAPPRAVPNEEDLRLR